jgi:hypothetical protein
VNYRFRTQDRGMPTAKTSRVTVELETGADPIRGSIERSDGRSQPFWGWLELIDTLERAARDQPEGDARPSPAKSRQPAKPDGRAERGKPETPGEEHS